MVSPEEVQAQEGAIHADDREPGLEIGFIPSLADVGLGWGQLLSACLCWPS